VSRDDLLTVFRGVVTTKRYASQYREQYESYPATRSGFTAWRDRRDEIDETFYDALDLSQSHRKY
jgi:phosphoribulokinase